MTDQTRYRIVCADGSVARTIYDKAEAEHRRRILDDELRWHCGPHTVEPVEQEDSDA